MTEEAAFYERLKKRLEETSTFPADYMFKFVFPADAEKLRALRARFERFSPRVSVRTSKNGKYTSVTILICAPDAETIVIKYREASEIEGIIIL